MAKKKTHIDLSEVLETFKASVIDSYEWKKRRLTSKIRKQITAIAIGDIDPHFGSSEHKEWQDLNAYYKIFSYQDYLQWADKNISIPDRKGELKSQLDKRSTQEKKRLRSFSNLWEKLHITFFNCLDGETLSFLDELYGEKHLIDKATALPYSNPLAWETKEEIRLDFYALVHRKNRTPLNGITDVQIPILRSAVTAIKWASMMKSLANDHYLDQIYVTDENLLKTWIVSAISFTDTTTPVNKIDKLRWIGPATAFAEWLSEVRKRMLDYRQADNRLLLEWVDATIQYPGTKRSLHSALASSITYKSKYFTFMGKDNAIAFKVNMLPRSSGK